MKTKLLFLMLLAVITTGFSQVTSVALVGEAAGGWPGDPGNPGPVDVHQMTSADGENWTLSDITLTTAIANGGVKFRANNAWDINWGSASFPNGTGTQGGANIVCFSGTYTVTFNSTTGVYAFGGGTPVPVVKIFGTAVNAPPGGEPLATLDLENYTISNITLLDGTAQFDIDMSIFGGDTFPSGVASDPNLFIPVTAGEYSSVSVNINTGEYSFVLAPIYPNIAIVGAGVGGWPGDPGNPGPIDVNQMTTTDGIIYTIDGLVCTVGLAKFRQNNDWTTNWGSTAFPTGTGVQGGDNIEITTAGTYSVTFNRTTGEYSFAFPSIAVVGAGVGGWPGDPGNPGPIDVHQMTTTDGENYVVLSVAATEGPAKFRQNNNWTVNWGAADFPVGLGTQGGDNIAISPAGTYDIAFNKTTGAYGFIPSLKTVNFNTSSFKVSPNPTQSGWNFTSNLNSKIDSILIVNVLGKTVKTISPKSISAIVDASDLNSGLYFAKITSSNGTETVKLVKN